jgi:DNA gyrase subunit A
MEDFTLWQQSLKEDQELLVISRSGKAYTLAVAGIPLQRRSSKGVPLVTLLPEDLHTDPSQVLCALPLPVDCDQKALLAFTVGGKIKRLPLGDFQHLTQRGLTLMKLKEEDQLLKVGLLDQHPFAVVGSSSGRLLRFTIDDTQVPIQGRNTQGQTVMRLRSQEQLIGGTGVCANDIIVLISAQGYGKRVKVDDIPLGARGDLGNTGFHFSRRGDQLVALQAVRDEEELVVMTNQNRYARISVQQLPLGGKQSRETQALMALNTGEVVITVKSCSAL